jgi:hypothetical protein
MLSGWRTHSEIPLTDVPTSVGEAGPPDVMIEIGPGHSPIPKSARRFIFQHTGKCSWISIKDVVDFEVSEGRHIRVWPAVAATQKDIEIFLFGPVWATLCHQRGLLPLHASAIKTKGGITAFAGHSGAGKSTTAALMNFLGYELIADDILPISLNQDSIPGAWPYLRRLKLHRDPLLRFALTPAEVVSETLDKEKFFFRPKQAGADKWSRLERLYMLENDGDASDIPIEQINGADAVRALVDYTYQFNFIRDTQRVGEHLAFCARLASTIPIYRLHRASLVDEGKRLGSLIYAHLEGGGSLIG